MTSFRTVREAKEFLASIIVTEAEREKVTLSEVERKMLYFSESGWTLPDIMEVNDEFEREYDDVAYEKKIADLIRRANVRLRKTDPATFATWQSAIRKLHTEDHYLSVMIHQAGISTRQGRAGWKQKFWVDVLVLFFVSCMIAINPLMHHFGLWLPRAGIPSRYDSYTINENLSKIIGYAWLCLLILTFCGLAHYHFDPKRRLETFLERMVGRIFKVFGTDGR